ncbi:MAG: saccharopine dehydrogenase C-terminal domain-containing protein [Bacillota bacterium]
MKIMVIGSGMMGLAIVSDLAARSRADQITAADRDPAAARRAVKGGASSAARIIPTELDLCDADRAVRLMRDHDMVVGAYPEEWAVRATEYALEAGTHLVDITALRDWESRAKMDRQLKRAGIAVIPGCGLAPGLGNILMGIAADRVTNPHAGMIMVGGLPKDPGPPLDYTIVFSLDTVIDEYTVRPRIITGGQIRSVDPLSGLEPVTFDPPVGEAECFYTDGLTTLLDTMPRRGLREVAEKTVRYPGHRDRVALLAKCGLFDEQPLEVEGATIIPRRFTSSVLTPLLRDEEAEDVSCLRVTVRGEDAVQFDLVDHFDRANGVTSMARTTGYTCSIVAQMLADGHIAQRGFIPPEEAITERNYREFHRQLRQRGIHVIEREPGQQHR